MKHKAAPWKIVYIVIALAIILWIDLGSTLPLLLHRPDTVAHEEFDLNECDLYIEDAVATERSSKYQPTSSLR